MSESTDIIVGIHSIYHAIKNPKRSAGELIATQEGFDFLKKSYPQENFPNIKLLKGHDFQMQAKQEIVGQGFQFQKVVSGILYKVPSLESGNWGNLLKDLETSPKKLLALDQVTDIHNLAAITRTAAFFGVHGIVFSHKRQRGYPPGFFRVASGAAEHLELYNTPSLAKSLNKLKTKNVRILALSEHAEKSFEEEKSGADQSFCLVFGSEDQGISNSVQFAADEVVRLNPQGQIQSLNVSVSVALGLEKLWGFNL